MLAYNLAGDWFQWAAGTRVPTSKLTPPPNAETVLSTEELEAIGLYRVTQESVPEGKVATAWTLVDEAGAPVLRPTLADAAVVVPSEITNYQMRTILRREGHLASVQALVQQAEDEELLDAFEYANFVYRNGQSVAAIGAAMGWTSAYLDYLFTEGAKIEA
jgi:hypothetical protein